jgi:beta-1,4-mannosyltransferase
MQYHTLSLLQNGYTVSLIGYTGTPLIHPLEEASQQQKQLHVIRVQPSTPWKFLTQTKVFKPVYYLVRLMELIRVLGYALLQMMMHSNNGVDCLLVQNPPSIPSLVLSYFFCYFYGATLIIDWHNLGFTMLTDLKETHWIRRLAYRYEQYMSQKADGHLCVTKAMKQFLHQTFHLISDEDDSSSSSSSSRSRIKVLYDRPPSFFRRTTSNERIDLMNRLDATTNASNNNNTILPSTFPAKDLLVNQANQQNQQRTALVISSTSWTPEEDFHILLEALIKLDHILTTATSNHATTTFPKVAVVVTGKGPQKSMYQKQILQLRPTLSKVTIDTMW